MIDLIAYSSFHFLRPWWLALLLPTLLLALRLRGVKQVPPVPPEIAPHIAAALRVPAGKRPRLNPSSLSILLLGLLSLLLAGPSWQRQESPFVQDQAALVIALDMSSSMLQDDIQPNRLARAKLKIADLLQMRGAARSGIVVFAGSAHQLLPLTSDQSIAKQFLQAAEHQVMPSGGKRAARLLPVVDKMLAASQSPGTVLLISDGLDAASAAPIAEYFQGSATQLIVYGMGSADPSGEHIKLQATALSNLASAAGGRYQAFSFDKSDVRRIQRLIKHHRDIAGEDGRPWMDAGYYLLIPISLLLLLCFRSGWAIQCVLLFTLTSSLLAPPASYAQEGEKDYLRTDIKHHFLSLWLTPDQLGQWYFERGEYQRAAATFEDTAWQATAFYYHENFSAAEQLYQTLDTDEARFNLANSLAQQQRYVDAIGVYQDLLADVPSHQAARENLQRLQDLVDEINQMSESQRAEAGKQTRELGDQPQRADGAQQADQKTPAVEQLTAAQLLADQQILAMWMRQVQADPSRFLRAKFQLQYQAQRQAEAAQDE